MGNGVTNADATGSMIPNCRMQKHPHLDSFMYSIDFLDFPGPHLYPPSFDSEITQEELDSIIANFSESQLIGEEKDFAPSLALGSASSKDLAVLEVFSKEQVNENYTYTVTCPKEGNMTFYTIKIFFSSVVLDTFPIFAVHHFFQI